MIDLLKKYREKRNFDRRAKQISEFLASHTIGEVLSDFYLDTRFPEASQFAALNGIIEMDDEKAEASVEASNERLERVAHLLPLISFFTENLTSTVMDYYKTVTTNDDNEFPDEFYEHFGEIIERISFSAVIGTIQQLERIGFVRYTGHKYE